MGHNECVIASERMRDHETTKETLVVLALKSLRLESLDLSASW